MATGRINQITSFRKSLHSVRLARSVKTDPWSLTGFQAFTKSSRIKRLLFIKRRGSKPVRQLTRKLPTPIIKFYQSFKLRETFKIHARRVKTIKNTTTHIASSASRTLLTTPRGARSTESPFDRFLKHSRSQTRSGK